MNAQTINPASVTLDEIVRLFPGSPAVRELYDLRARASPVGDKTWWERVNHYGYTPDEASKCPAGFPLRLFRICEREGKAALELFVDAKAAGETHDTLAEKWGVPKNTVRNWSAKYGPNGPNGRKG